MTTFRTLTGVLAGSLLAVAGCSSVHMETERQLAAAGFQVKIASTPEQMEHLQDLPQHKVFATQKDGQTVYVYADASDCKCLYAGTPKDFQQYSAIRIQQNQVNAERAAAADMRMAEMDAEMRWETWGAWGRPFVW